MCIVGLSCVFVRLLPLECTNLRDGLNEVNLGISVPRVAFSGLSLRYLWKALNL